jgi:hypothetical protein
MNAAKGDAHMKKPTKIISLLAGVMIAALAPGSLAAGSDSIREITRSIPVEGRQAVRLDFPVAEIRVSGTSSPEVEVELTATCKREHDCEEILGSLDLETSGSGRTLRIDLVGYPKWGKGRVEIEGELLVPRKLELEVELGVGQLELKDLADDLRVELGVGEINAWIERSNTHSVTLDAGVGEVELYGTEERIEGRRSMLVGSETHWDAGAGDARVFLQVGVGEITVWME